MKTYAIEIGEDLTAKQVKQILQDNDIQVTDIKEKKTFGLDHAEALKRAVDALDVELANVHTDYVKNTMLNRRAKLQEMLDYIFNGVNL